MLNKMFIPANYLWSVYVYAYVYACIYVCIQTHIIYVEKETDIEKQRQREKETEPTSVSNETRDRNGNGVAKQRCSQPLGPHQRKVRPIL